MDSTFQLGTGGAADLEKGYTLAAVKASGLRRFRSGAGS
jgi:hypothetical protein